MTLTIHEITTPFTLTVDTSVTTYVEFEATGMDYQQGNAAKTAKMTAVARGTDSTGPFELEFLWSGGNNHMTHIKGDVYLAQMKFSSRTDLTGGVVDELIVTVANPDPADPPVNQSLFPPDYLLYFPDS